MLHCSVRSRVTSLSNTIDMQHQPKHSLTSSTARAIPKSHRSPQCPAATTGIVHLHRLPLQRQRALPLRGRILQRRPRQLQQRPIHLQHHPPRMATRHKPQLSPAPQRPRLDARRQHRRHLPIRGRVLIPQTRHILPLQRLLAPRPEHARMEPDRNQRQNPSGPQRPPHDLPQTVHPPLRRIPRHLRVDEIPKRSMGLRHGELHLARAETGPRGAEARP